jgi:hypothetical protein
MAKEIKRVCEINQFLNEKKKEFLQLKSKFLVIKSWLKKHKLPTIVLKADYDELN